MDENGNTVFMQHILANDYGIPMDITVSSYQSADFQKIDQVCEPQKLFTNHILVIPYQPVPLSELGRYVMLPALAEFQHPDTSEELQLLPGIGKSTAGAILSLGFGIKAPILDGNAKRVLVRYYNINDPVDLTSTVNQLWEIAENNLPENECDVYTQAIMDVGALICKRSNPLCSKCPLIETCVSRKENKHNLLPIRSPKKEKPVKKLYWLIMQNEEGEILLENKKNKGVWEGLWTFLGFKEEDSRREYIEQLNENYTVIMKDKRIKHSFTHYKLDIDLQHIRMHGKIQNLDNNKVWFNNNDIMKVGLPSPVAKELERIKKNDSNSFLQKMTGFRVRKSDENTDKRIQPNFKDPNGPISAIKEKDLTKSQNVTTHEDNLKEDIPAFLRRQAN